MKRILILFLLLTSMILLLGSCVDNDYYYVPDGNGSSTVRNIHIDGQVVGQDSLLNCDSISIVWFPYDWFGDSSELSPDSLGFFQFNYSLSYGEKIRMIFNPNDSNFKRLDTLITFQGRDLTTGHRALEICLDTL